MPIAAQGGNFFIAMCAYQYFAEPPINHVEELLPWNVADTTHGDNNLELAA